METHIDIYIRLKENVTTGTLVVITELNEWQ